jgi:hypothetical protein
MKRVFYLICVSVFLSGCQCHRCKSASVDQLIKIDISKDLPKKTVHLQSIADISSDTIFKFTKERDLVPFAVLTSSVHATEPRKVWTSLLTTDKFILLLGLMKT